MIIKKLTILLIAGALSLSSCFFIEEFKFKQENILSASLDKFVSNIQNKKYENTTCTSYVEAFTQEVMQNSYTHLLDKSKMKTSGEVYDLFSNFKKSILSASFDEKCTKKIVHLIATIEYLLESIDISKKAKINLNLKALREVVRSGDIILIRSVLVNRLILPDFEINKYNQLLIVDKVENDRVLVFSESDKKESYDLSEFISDQQKGPVARLKVLRSNNGLELVTQLKKLLYPKRNAPSSFLVNSNQDSLLSKTIEALKLVGQNVAPISYKMNNHNRDFFKIKSMLSLSSLDYFNDLEVILDNTYYTAKIVHKFDSYFEYLDKLKDNAKFTYLFRTKFMEYINKYDQRTEENIYYSKSVEVVAVLETLKFLTQELQEVMKKNLEYPKGIYTKFEIDEFYIKLGHPYSL